MNEKIIVLRISKVKMNTIVYEVECSSDLRKYFDNKKFFIKYSFEIHDLPESILLIPAVGYVLPLALVSGAKIYIDTIDQEYYTSVTSTLLKKVGKYYPKLPLNKFKIEAKRIVKYKPTKRGYRKALFFSGGIDSTHMLLRHLHEKPLLITIWGADIKLSEYSRLRKFLNYVRYLANHLGLKFNFITFYDTVNRRLVDAYFFRKLYGNDTWGGIFAGIFYPALAAPLVGLGVSSIYIASGIPSSIRYPWSDRCDVYEITRFAGVRVVCDDDRLTRFQKVIYIKNNIHLLEKKGVRPVFRSCLASSADLNCGYCEKCMRTILELTFAGIDPSKHGFNINTSSYKYYVKNVLKNRRLLLDLIDLIFWYEIKELSRLHNEYSFLASINFEKLLARRKRILRLSLLYIANKMTGNIINNVSERLGLNPIIDRLVKLLK